MLLHFMFILPYIISIGCCYTSIYGRKYLISLLSDLIKERIVYQKSEFLQNWERVHFKNKTNNVKYASTTNQINRY